LAAGWSPWRQYGQSKKAAIEAMDEAVKAGASLEDEAATMTPPTPSSDRTTLELKAIRLAVEDSQLWVVFDVAGTLYHGPLSKFEPADLIKREDER
tara:strand:- start:36 stop:323 length:288 start_codon:yes stop_codon:yes gene_type:complete